MRFALAIAALVLSGVLLVLGIGQSTFLAGPAEISVTADVPNGTRYVSIPGDAFSAEQGEPFIEVNGDGAFVATGADRDVNAWLAAVDHVAYSADAGAKEWEYQALSAQPVQSQGAADGTDAEPANAVTQYDPRGSDLWIRESVNTEDAENLVRLPTSGTSGESILVQFSENADNSEVSLVWVQDTRTPLAGPLLAAGALFAVIGLILYLLAVDHDRRGLGPQRGQKGPFWGIRNALFSPRKTRTTVSPGSPGNTEIEGSAKSERNAPMRSSRRVVPVLAIALTVGLSGCSAQYWPDFSASSDDPVETTGDAQTTTAAPTPVTPEQIDRIIADVAGVAASGDDSLDASLLESRFMGDALAQRSTNYTVRSSVPDYRVVPPRITNEALDYELVQSTEGWPRTIFVTVSSDPGTESAEASETESDTASPSLAMILTQASPHDNFMVSRIFALRGGITMPEAAPAEEGTALLADDLQTLRVAPGEVGKAYAAVLAGGTGVEQAALFNLDGDTLIERSGAAWAAQSQATADAAGQGVQYSVTATQTETPIVSLSTGVGGALVSTTVVEERIEEPGSGRWKPTPPASVTALSGLSGQQDKLVSVVTHQLLFYVPGKDSEEPIQLLGYSSDLTGARNS